MFEKPFGKLLFACRWLLAPLYIGLAIALIALGVLDRMSFAGHREH